ncbi:MAG: L,D-transpeptidase family protein [Candidatus Omnitrophica bacterium]|nr:L,D-transpeptidase family protein [Candidatus Omnitrophota bacterium]MCF7892721.1 L,D-transpeptidase family protein [Candidatus Omnitrophota bacterium]
MNKKIIFVIAAVVVLGLIAGLIFSSGEKEEAKQEEVKQKKSFSFASVNGLIKKNKYKEAKNLLEKKKKEIVDPLMINQIQDKIYEINIKMLFSPYREEECSKVYTVKRGDALVKIARKFDTTVELIKKANNLSSVKIIPGQELKVNTCEFSLVVDKSQNLLFLKRDGKIFKTYTVATGKNGRTPEGSFKIINKLVKPTWYKAGAVVLPDNPENILGSRWLGIDKSGYGIHGTTEPDSLGQQVTLGCVRMANQEVEELYDIVPTGTEVIIVE